MRKRCIMFYSASVLGWDGMVWDGYTGTECVVEGCGRLTESPEPQDVLETKDSGDAQL